MANARRIDTHAHIVPDFYRAWLSDKGVINRENAELLFKRLETVAN